MKDNRFVAIFSGQEFRPQTFNGGSALTCFGGADVLAANAAITADCELTATALFGGLEIHLPATVNVVVKSFALFGGIGNERVLPSIEGAPTVYVRAFALFGGVDIK